MAMAMAMASLPLDLVARTTAALDAQATPAQGTLESAGAGITGGMFSLPFLCLLSFVVWLLGVLTS